MPIPEELRLYGRVDLLDVISDPQPTARNPPWNPAVRHRNVTRTITFHFVHGWVVGDWRAQGNAWFGATFNIDLDGTLYQCQEMIVRTNHVGGGNYFGNQVWNFVNSTSIGVEVARFGSIRQRQDGTYAVDGYDGINFAEVDTWPIECDYGEQPNVKQGGTHRFKLDKIPGGIVLQNTSRGRNSRTGQLLPGFNHYYIKVAPFRDGRNHEENTHPLDVLFTEEQYKTMVSWAKSMCEMHRIPKAFLPHPTTGRAYPWGFVRQLIEAGTPQEQENKERVRAFQGIIGHKNIQHDRSDPGPSMDYYRIKRGISDEWWYPINHDSSIRAINYLDVEHVNDYMAMKEYNAMSQIERYFSICEGKTGFFPVGLNRLWHGGIHLPSGQESRPVYAMANGRIVAARVSNGLVDSGDGPRELSYSRCFVLIRHEVHTRDINGIEIDYGDNSTETIYSLYMHLRPMTFGQGPFVIDYNTYPIWVNHYMLDHPDDTAPRLGEVFYPDQPIILSDLVGHKGTYITQIVNGTPVYGSTVHVEVFTAADVSQFSGSPWVDVSNRVEDNNPDLICDLNTLDKWIIDKGFPSIDSDEILTSVKDMRQIAVRYRSEWSLEKIDQIGTEVFLLRLINWIRGEPSSSVTEKQWLENVKPFCFHAEMQSTADENVIGPFMTQPNVWHVHPFEFMRWMNGRVSRHEKLMRSQDKTRGQFASTIIVENGYAVRFANPVPSIRPSTGYAEVRWADNLYEITVDQLCDFVELAIAPQQYTRFNMLLLDAIEIINDRPHGITVVLGYISSVVNSRSIYGSRHLTGDAVDIRPANPVNVASWYTFFRSVESVVSYINNRSGANSISTIEMLQDPNDQQELAQLTPNSTEWLRRLRDSTSPNDELLTSAVTDYPTLLSEIGRMRIHLHAN